MDEIESLKAYFDERFASLKEAVMQEIKHLSEKLEAALQPVTKDIDRLRTDIGELYGKTRDNEIRIAQLEQGQKDKDKSSSKTIATLGVIIAALGIGIGLAVAILA